MQTEEMNIFWFRRDLRLIDNTALNTALSEGKPVLPIFIFDKAIIDKLPKKDARLAFIHRTLHKIKKKLENKYDSTLALFYGDPLQIYKELIKTYKIATVYTNHDYEPYALKRDNEVYNLLRKNDINFKTFKDQVVFEKDEIVKADGSPYMVYTPYMRKWKEAFKTNYRSSNINFNPSNLIKKDPFSNISLQSLGFEETNLYPKNYNDSPSLIEEYEAKRNFPAIDGTSYLGVYLRFGTVSIRDIVKKAIVQKNETFLNELIWREFFMQILWHFPYTTKSSFKKKYDRIQWNNNEVDFKNWCEGTTGYPLVDAGMRQLNKTGFMHNRVRMLVGSFLCKHLLIDWRWGEAYFAEKLFDYEMASNIGNWQWVAGCGVDAAPYFRIFNPITQIKKFDTQLEYINRWVEDLNKLSYPQPIIEHTFARERCLKTYKEALN